MHFRPAYISNEALSIHLVVVIQLNAFYQRIANDQLKRGILFWSRALGFKVLSNGSEALGKLHIIHPEPHFLKIENIDIAAEASHSYNCVSPCGLIVERE